MVPGPGDCGLGGNFASKARQCEFGKYENAQSGSRYDYLFERPPPPTDRTDPRFAPQLKVYIPKTVKESCEMIREALHRDAPSLFFEDRLVKE